MNFSLLMLALVAFFVTFGHSLPLVPDVHHDKYLAEESMPNVRVARQYGFGSANAMALANANGGGYGGYPGGYGGYPGGYGGYGGYPGYGGGGSSNAVALANANSMG